MVTVLVVMLAGLAFMTVSALGLLHAGLRAGDRLGDAKVSAVLGAVPGPAGQPGGPKPVVIVTVRNPGDVSLLAGLSARRRLIPGWLDGGLTVHVPRRTARRRFRAPAHDVTGIVPAGTDARFSVPVASVARRYRLTAVIGQSGGRLRVLRVAVAGQYSIPFSAAASLHS